MASENASDTEEIARVLRAINAAWTGGDAEAMRQYLDERIVMAQPGFEERLVGRQACIESYEDFARQARVHSYVESQTTVDVMGDTAVASYRFAIDYAMGDKQHHEAGHDLFVFARSDGRWRAVWRTLIPEPAHTAEG
jgi:uncharacterized protein (TIGR02246 family)